MKIYKLEIKTHPFPRSKKSIEALWILRDRKSNLKYAEPFELIYEIV